METSLYSVYDSKARVYGHPFHAANDAVAVRMFADVCNDPDTTINKHPEDFILFKMARFDDQTGEITTHVLTSVTTAISLRSDKK